MWTLDWLDDEKTQGWWLAYNHHPKWMVVPDQKRVLEPLNRDHARFGALRAVWLWGEKTGRWETSTEYLEAIIREGWISWRILYLLSH